VSISVLPIIPAAQLNREKAMQYTSETYGISADQLQSVYETTRDLPLLNKHLYVAKVFDNQLRQTYTVYIDTATGNQVDYNNLLREEAREYSKRYGKMSVDLFSHVQSMRTNDTVEVWIWLTPINEALVPPRATGDKEASQRTTQLKSLFAEKEEPIMAWLDNRGIKVTYASRYAPLVFANLPKQYILEIQQLADVAWLEMTGKLELAG